MTLAGNHVTAQRTTSRQPARASGWAWSLGTFVVVACVVLAIYGRALEAPFIFDDLPTIVENPSIRRLWPLVGNARDPGPLRPPGKASTSRRPLPNLTFAVDYAVGGLRPVGYRLVNVTLHVLTATVLAALVRRTLLLPSCSTWAGSAAGPLAMAVALLWALHPLVTETVVYVTQRTELLAALGYLATLWAAVRYWTAPAPATRGRWVVAAALACLAGVLSKEVVVSAPLVVALYERTFVASSWRDLRRSAPLYVALALTWIPVLLLNLGGASGLSDARHYVPPWVWWMTQTKVVLLYVKLVLWPWPLTIHYAPIYFWTVPQAAPWLLAAGAFAMVTFALVRRRPAARFVVAAALLMLAPTLVIPLAKMVASERRMYLPLTGLVALAVVGGYAVLGVEGSRARRRVAVVAVAVVATVLGVVSAHRLGAYQSAVAIWADAVRHQPADAMAQYNLGVALVGANRPPEEAIARFEESIRLDPGHVGAHDNLGMVLLRQHRYDDARRRFEEALALDRDDAIAHNDLGALFLALDRPAEALPHLEHALAHELDLPKATVHSNLGKALVELGRPTEALSHLDEALRLAPDDADARYNRGSALLALGRYADAVPAYAAALERRPGDPDIENNLASALLQTGRIAEAISHLEHVLAEQPRNVAARNNLGTALRSLGRTPEAMEQFRAVLAQDPDNVTAHFNLGSALLDGGQPADAVPHFEAVLRRAPDDAQARFKCAIAFMQSGRRGEALAMADRALAAARAHAVPALAADIETWLASYRDLPASR